MGEMIDRVGRSGDAACSCHLNRTAPNAQRGQQLCRCRVQLRGRIEGAGSVLTLRPDRPLEAVLGRSRTQSKLPKVARGGSRYFGADIRTDPTLNIAGQTLAAMVENSTTIETIEALRAFVRGTLCGKENLVEDQFSMREMPLVLYGNPCGLQFTIQGPRSVRLSAVWAVDASMVYFYDARGERFLKVRVDTRFEWQATAA